MYASSIFNANGCKIGDFEPPNIENWFFAAPKNSVFIKLWCDEFMKINNYDNLDDYIKETSKMGVKSYMTNDYHTMHLAVQVILQKNKYDLNKLYLFQAEDGPFKYLAKNNWNDQKAFDKLCVDKTLQTPIIKMTGGTRSFLDKHPEIDCIYKL